MFALSRCIIFFLAGAWHASRAIHKTKTPLITALAHFAHFLGLAYLFFVAWRPIFGYTGYVTWFFFLIAVPTVALYGALGAYWCVYPPTVVDLGFGVVMVCAAEFLGTFSGLGMYVQLLVLVVANEGSIVYRRTNLLSDWFPVTVLPLTVMYLGALFVNTHMLLLEQTYGLLLSAALLLVVRASERHFVSFGKDKTNA